MIDAAILGGVVLALGESDLNEPIVGGAIVFGIITAALYYLAYVRTEMNAGLILRTAPFVTLLLTFISLAWPWRPWPH